MSFWESFTFEAIIIFLITSIIYLVIGFVLSNLRDWLKNRKEKRRINELFLNLFDSFTLLENPLKARKRALLIIQCIGEELILEKS